MNARWLREYFSFTKKERSAILLLLGLIALVWCLPEIFPKSPVYKQGDILEFEKQISRLKELNQGLSGSKDSVGSLHEFPKVAAFSNPHPALFYFDPNAASSEDWRRLGLKENTIRTIQNYLLHGGHFRKAEDLKKIYGLPNPVFEKLLPFIRIQKSSSQNFYSPTEKNQPGFEHRNFIGKQKKFIDLSIDINEADTSAWIALPGIGSKLAARIVHFREKLGGFYAIEQIAETFGLPDSTFQSIRPWLKYKPSFLKKLNINTAPMDSLANHPYLRFSLAKAIVQYRNQHGEFQDAGDIMKIAVITPEIFRKISPYLIVH